MSWAANKLNVLSAALAFKAKQLNFLVSGARNCCYCGRELAPTTYTVDHVKPRIASGRTEPDNLMACCKSCNKAKGPMHVDEFRRHCIGRDRLFFFESGKPVAVDYRFGYVPKFKTKKRP